MTIASLLLGLVGVAVALLPLGGRVGLGFGPFVALCGGGISVAGLVLGLAVLLWRGLSPAKDGRVARTGRLHRAAILLGAAGALLSLVVERRLVAREQAADTAAAGPRDAESLRRKAADDQQFDDQLKENLNK